MKKKTAIRKSVAGLFAACLVLGAWAEGPTVTGVTVRQRWPWSRQVDIDYTLECDPDQRADITMRAYNGTADVRIPIESLSGELSNVPSGARHAGWHPVQAGYTNEILPKFHVELTAVRVPLYLIVDLTKAKGESNQIEYVYEEDLAGGAYGVVATNPVVGIDSIVWIGATSNDVYKTDKLVLRRVAGNSCMLGLATPPQNPVTLTHDLYAGVFEVTQAQWYNVMSNWPSYFTNIVYRATRPVEQVTYNDIRGKTNDNPVIDWPMTGSAVSSNSFLGKLREKTGIDGFDLPTEAQWEYVCRAGTTTYYNDGKGTPANTQSNEQMLVLGRYMYNKVGSLYSPEWNISTENGTQAVGFYLPNAWGLYDTHRNVWEWCRDWHTATRPSGTNPPGPTSGTTRLQRSGGWANNGEMNGSNDLTSKTPSTKGVAAGFRVVITRP